jgi:hypothetical protein
MASVIAKDEVMPLLLQACPSFVEPWKAYSFVGAGIKPEE